MDEGWLEVAIGYFLQEGIVSVYSYSKNIVSMLVNCICGWNLEVTHPCDITKIPGRAQGEQGGRGGRKGVKGKWDEGGGDH